MVDSSKTCSLSLSLLGSMKLMKRECSGGGLSSVQKQVLNIMDNSGEDDTATGGEGQELTNQGVKKQLLNLEKVVNKNRDLRTKFPNDPEKYVTSTSLSPCL